jgi:hypothetical protein
VEKPFLPKWPPRLVQVALADSDHGRRFDHVLCEKGRKDPLQRQKLSWMLVNLVHAVPKIWKSLDSMVHSNRSWEGWVLIYLLHQLPLTSLKAKKCPFHFSQVSKKGKLQDIVCCAAKESRGSLHDWLGNLFQHHPMVNVCTGIPGDPKLILENQQVVMVVFDPEEESLVRLEDSLFSGKWELRIVFTSKNKMYVRHGKGAQSFWECDIRGAVKKIFNLSLRSL